MKACRLMKAYDKKTSKLYLALPENPIRDRVKQVVEESTAVRKDGRAVMGGMKRLIQKMLSDTTEKIEEDEDLE